MICHCQVTFSSPQEVSQEWGWQWHRGRALLGLDAVGAQWRFFFLGETLFTDPGTGDLFSTICLCVPASAYPAGRREHCFFLWSQSLFPFLSMERLDGELICWGVSAYKQPWRWYTWLIGRKRWLALRKRWRPLAKRVMEARRCHCDCRWPGSCLIHCFSEFSELWVTLGAPPLLMSYVNASVFSGGANGFCIADFFYFFQ